MLEPTNRFMVVDALRPPDGYALDIAVGTTFALDLDALLLATVSFAVFDRLDTDDGRPDPIALLESVRRHADHITVFAQAGALSGPRNHPPILAYLEDSVIPVRPPWPGHLFHPKVWALRFVDAGATPRYRLVVMSRNLTFDSSWDTIVQLDGTPTDSPAKNIAIVGKFIDQLPGLALHPLDSRRSADISRLATELRSVSWELPAGVRWLRFHPLGPGFVTPAIRGRRIIVMSPFLTEETVRDLAESPGPNVLVSRAAALDGVGADALAGYAETLVLDTGEDALGGLAVAEPLETGEGPAGDDLADLDIEPPRAGVELSGLHAKVYVTEGDDYTRLWMGSANATSAAFAGNAEFLIELGLDPAQWSIDRFLDDGGKTSLRAMLVPYRPASPEPAAPSAREEAARRLDAVLRELAASPHTVHVTSLGDDYRLQLGWDPLTAGMQQRLSTHGIGVTIGPATQAGFRVPYSDTGATIPSVTLQAITSFLVIEARTRVDGRDITGRTLVNARLSGAPTDRKEQLLASVLDDPDKVLRYLLFLLAELTGDETLLDVLGGHGATFDWSTSAAMPPLLETLLRALAHAPESLDRVAEFIDDLQAGTSGGLLPSGFDDVWHPIREARRLLQ